jgi:hypothetical protein
MASGHTIPMIRRMDLLVEERREIRAHWAPGTVMSAEDRDRIVAIDAALDALWVERRRSRVPSGPPPPSGRSLARR